MTSQQPKDNRTSMEVLEGIIKEVPINTYWREFPQKSKNSNLEHHEILYWVYGYEVNKDSNSIWVKSKIIEYSNELWSMKSGTMFTHRSQVEQIDKKEFERAEMNIVKGYEYIDAIRDTNKLNSTWNFPTKELHELKKGDKFIYFLNEGRVIRFGEMVNDIPSFEFNDKHLVSDDSEFNSKIRHFTYNHDRSTDDYFSMIGKMCNWKVNDKEEYYIIDQEYFNMLNEIYDDMIFYYDCYMLCQSPEEVRNLRRAYKLDKILE